MTGNYELAYAVGFLMDQMKNSFSKEEKNNIDIKKLQELFQAGLAEKHPWDLYHQ